MVAEILMAVKIKPLQEGGSLATSNELPGLVAQGRTVAGAMGRARDVARKLMESCIEYGDPLSPSVRRAVAPRRKRRARVRTPATVGLEAAIG